MNRLTARSVTTGSARNRRLDAAAMLVLLLALVVGAITALGLLTTIPVAVAAV